VLPKDSLEASVSLKKVCLFSKFVNASHPVIIKGLGDGSKIAVYGCDPSEEGAVVFVYDILYDLVVSKQSLKLYGNPPVMEIVSGSVLIPVGVHILVLSLRVEKSLLSKLVGKHQIQSSEEVFEDRNPWVKNLDGWGIAENNEFDQSTDEVSLLKTKYPEFWQLVQQAQTLQIEGHPESM